MPDTCLELDAIAEVFAEEVVRLEGRTLDTFRDRRRLFARSALPLAKRVSPHDHVVGGVALKANSREICVCPYLVRREYGNGAIMAHGADAFRASMAPPGSPHVSESGLRAAIRRCGRKEVFCESVRDISMTTSKNDDFALMMLPMLSRLSRHVSEPLLKRILDHFVREEERSQGSLMNATVSVARETADPEQRWRLEELGGAIGANLLPPIPSDEFCLDPVLRSFAHEGALGQRIVVA